MLTLISTDLDGTLLDHHDYSWHAAEPALNRAAELGVPVLFNTSKNAIEAISLRDEVGLSAPVIVENGSALVVSAEHDWAAAVSDSGNGPELVAHDGNQHLVFGARRDKILDLIAQWRADYGWRFSGFNDWSTDEIVEQTGLSEVAAGRAAQKQYSEPFIWQDSDAALEELKLQAARAGLSVLQGGRFYHLQGMTDKAQPLHWFGANIDKPAVRALFSVQPDDDAGTAKIKLICLGDNHNDVAMLNAADIAVCVRSPIGDFPLLEARGNVVYTEGYGPVGWNQAVMSLLSRESASDPRHDRATL